MKTTIYTCDGPDCKRQGTNVNHWLEIGTTDEDGIGLQVRNGLSDSRLETMNNGFDIHFCSRDCFVNYFFMPVKDKAPEE